MARKNPLPEEKIEEGRRIRLLRQTLKVHRTVFATMCGFSSVQLEAKETGRNPFRPEEIARIKEAVATHLAAGVRALESLSF